MKLQPGDGYLSLALRLETANLKHANHHIHFVRLIHRKMEEQKLQVLSFCYHK